VHIIQFLEDFDFGVQTEKGLPTMIHVTWEGIVGFMMNHAK